MNQSDFNNAMIAIELANTAVSAADSNKARKHATAEAEKARDWQEKMYDRQLDDQIAWRTHQEVYNSPEAQMKRYRDAGINPMYSITGNGHNTVMTPSGASVPMTNKADTPAPRNLRFNTGVFAQSAQIGLTKAQMKAAEAQANMYNATANEANARAEGVRYENTGRRLESLINDELEKITLRHPTTEGDSGSYVQWRAEVLAQATEFEYAFNQMSFWDAKAKFEHLGAVREFERDLNSHQRRLFQYELSQARSAAAVFRVSAKWAVRNQWIDASSRIVGAAGSLIGAFKGTSLMPSRSFSESYGDHTSHVFNY